MQDQRRKAGGQARRQQLAQVLALGHALLVPEHAQEWPLAGGYTHHLGAALELPGRQFIEWNGAQRWWRTAADGRAVRAYNYWYGVRHMFDGWRSK